MKPKVYIETSIPSYYHEIRDDPESAAKRLWTREWWAHHRFRFELLTAPPVLDELERGDYPTKQETLQFVAELPLLAVNEEIAEIVRRCPSSYACFLLQLPIPAHMELPPLGKCKQV